MVNRIHVKMPFPGPTTKKLIEEEKKYVSNSYTRDENYPLSIKKADGLWVTDLDGNTFLDCTAGIAVCSTGHCHKEVVDAIVKQAKNFIHMSGTDFYYESQLLLSKKLSGLSPGEKRKNVFFGNSGAEANEAAFKLSRFYTKRPNFISFYGSFHGRTIGMVSLSASKVIHKRDFGPFMPGIYHTYFADCYRCPFNLDEKTCDIYCINYIENHIFKTTINPESIAAFFLEPILGEGGYVVPPQKFIDGLKKLASKYGILIVADEVQCGMGRTGKMFASEHFNLIPDIVTLAKGIASGLPLSACIANHDIMTWTPGTHASTFGGNPISCRASLATIKLIENGLLKNAQTQGNFILENLKKFENEFEFIGIVRGLGLMIGIEIVTDKTSKKRNPFLRNKIIYDCLKKGLLLLPCGQSAIRFCPPLIISKEEAKLALNIFNEVLNQMKKVY